MFEFVLCSVLRCSFVNGSGLFLLGRYAIFLCPSLTTFLNVFDIRLLLFQVICVAARRCSCSGVSLRPLFACNHCWSEKYIKKTMHYDFKEQKYVCNNKDCNCNTGINQEEGCLFQ
jgi:hypothetical protein